MNLTGTVTKVSSGRLEADRLERITVKVNESTSPMYGEFIVPNVDGLKLDDQIEMTLRIAAKEAVHEQ